MSLSRLSTAIADGVLVLPNGKITIMRPAADYDISALPRDDVMIAQRLWIILRVHMQDLFKGGKSWRARPVREPLPLKNKRREFYLRVLREFYWTWIMAHILMLLHPIL